MISSLSRIDDAVKFETQFCPGIGVDDDILIPIDKANGLNCYNVKARR